MTTTAFVDGSTLSAAAWANDVDTIIYGSLGSISGTNTITAAGPASMTAYASKQRFWFIPANTNTGATTINITPSGGSALGARNIFNNAAACVGGELVANVPIALIDDGTRLNIIGIEAAVQTFTVTGTGFTANPTGTAKYTIIRNAVVLDLPTLSGTSNATTFTLTGIPAGITPANAKTVIVRTVDNSGAAVASLMTLNTDSTCTMSKNLDAGTAWTGSGTKQLLSVSVAYTLP